MFGISFYELIVIFGVALLVFGPEALPDLARKLGKLSAELRRASDGMRREFYNAVYTPAQDELSRTRQELANLRAELEAKTVGVTQVSMDPQCSDHAGMVPATSSGSPTPANATAAATENLSSAALTPGDPQQPVGTPADPTKS